VPLCKNTGHRHEERQVPLAPRTAKTKTQPPWARAAAVGWDACGFRFPSGATPADDCIRQSATAWQWQHTHATRSNRQLPAKPWELEAHTRGKHGRTANTSTLHEEASLEAATHTHTCATKCELWLAQLARCKQKPSSGDAAKRPPALVEKTP